MKDALLEQRKTFADHIASQVGVLTNPYRKLPTNVVTLIDTAKAMRYVLSKSSADFGGICISWTMGTQAFLRGASVRVLRLCDIVWDTAHGPLNARHQNLGMFGITLWKGPIHKDHHPKDWAVGTWLHCEVYCCASSYMCMS